METKIVIFKSNKDDGNMSYKYGDKKEVFNNRKKFFDKNNIEIDNTIGLICENQNKILHIINKPTDEFLYCDGIITKLKNFYFSVNFGDCVPFFVTNNKDIFAFAHLGKVSIKKDFQSVFVKEIINEYNINPSELKVYLGPCLSHKYYKFNDMTQEMINKWEDCIYYKDGYQHIDMKKYIIKKIKLLGIKEENITSSNEDTGDGFYFSNFMLKENKLPQQRFICGGGIRED